MDGIVDGRTRSCARASPIAAQRRRSPHTEVEETHASGPDRRPRRVPGADAERPPHDVMPGILAGGDPARAQSPARRAVAPGLPGGRSSPFAAAASRPPGSRSSTSRGSGGDRSGWMAIVRGRASPDLETGWSARRDANGRGSGLWRIRPVRPQPLTQDPRWLDAKPVTRDARDPLPATPAAGRTARQPRDPPDGGATRTLASTPRATAARAAFPRRDEIAIISDRDGRSAPSGPAPGGAPRELSSDSGRHYFSPRVGPDGERLVTISTRKSATEAGWGGEGPGRDARGRSSTAGASSSTRRFMPTGCRRGDSRSEGGAERQPAFLRRSPAASIFALRLRGLRPGSARTSG
jgi:hypothetical protein